MTVFADTDAFKAGYEDLLKYIHDYQEYGKKQSNPQYTPSYINATNFTPSRDDFTQKYASIQSYLDDSSFDYKSLQDWPAALDANNPDAKTNITFNSIRDTMDSLRSTLLNDKTLNISESDLPVLQIPSLDELIQRDKDEVAKAAEPLIKAQQQADTDSFNQAVQTAEDSYLKGTKATAQNPLSDGRSRTIREKHLGPYKTTISDETSLQGVIGSRDSNFDSYMQRTRMIDRLIPPSAGTEARFKKIRRYLGAEYNNIARGYSNAVTDLHRQFKAVHPGESFDKEVAKPFSDWSKKLFELEQQYYAGLHNQEKALVDAYNDASEGNPNFAKRFNEDSILQRAQAARSGNISKEVTRTFSDFQDVSFTDAKGAQQSWQIGKMVTDSLNANASLDQSSRTTDLLGRQITTDANGKQVYGEWKLLDADTQNRYLTSASAIPMDDATSRVAIQSLADDLGIDGLRIEDQAGREQLNLPTYVSNATGVSGTITQRIGVNPSAYTRTSDSLIGKLPINNAGRRMERQASADIAESIAKTQAAEGSGIMESIVGAVRQNPVIAGAIALGGFALVNKALDNRREYE